MDREIFALIHDETKRQNKGIELIASENYVSRDIRLACGSILTNKYAEGYPGKRYYGGCGIIDQIESLAIKRACKLFKAKYANVQPHSGSQANAAAYRGMLPKGGKILSLELNAGGHLTHGSKVSFSSHLYNFVHYGLDEEGRLDYKQIRDLAEKEKPDIILAGFSAYPYVIDFQCLKDICTAIGCYFMVDMAHFAGLVAAGIYPNPIDYADVVTSTTHKTLRGPRGGLILTNSQELSKKIDSAVFPYYQGGPLEHIIAAKAICFKEALSDDFKKYAECVVRNTKACADEFKELGALASGTETHLFLLDTLLGYHLTGRQAQEKLEEINITTNKNMLPNDKLSPKDTSGLRLGLAAVTSRGATTSDSKNIARLIDGYLKDEITKEEALAQVAGIVKSWRDTDDL